MGPQGKKKTLDKNNKIWKSEHDGALKGRRDFPLNSGDALH